MTHENFQHKSSILIDWLGLRRDELQVFVLATLALLCITASNVLFGNYAETTFLKRFGVHFLPTMILINAVVTFFVMSRVGRWLTRMSGQTLLSRTLVFCALSAALVRLMVPLGWPLLYPLVYVMKSQYELLLVFLFWNLANQVFSTRQSKRMFPLMVSGGLVGGIGGSVATPLVARLGSVDNILWVYLGGVLSATVLIRLMTRTVRAAAGAEKVSGKEHGRSSLFAGMRQALPVMRRSHLARWLVLLALIPNILIPLLNYQVSFAVDMTYANESTMLGFYSFYRGAQFVLALLVSLFAGRIYARFGLSGGLLVHPFNYLLIFVGFMLQFDIFTAVYAGISSGVIRRAIQTPARAALNGLFSDEQRVALMPFLRGVVVRVGILIGAVFVLICQSGYFVVCRFPLHPQNLAPFGFGFALLWLMVALRMKKHYPELVLETLGWYGPERGRINFAPEVVRAARKKLFLARRRLAQAVAVGQQNDGVHADRLVEHLRDTAARLAFEVLCELENWDSSGRLRTVREALQGGDARHRANALEALEQLVPHSLAYGLVRGLEKDLQGGWSYPGPVLQVLAVDDDQTTRELVRCLLGRVADGQEASAGRSSATGSMVN
ncbi:Npt1/Npt2 family nucleotide transporter [Geothermobacter hydrogeniphilus]|uniref:ADP,ATP carrier protein n=1 Tax=Geothermobacter hydrogeniphilus TaxID=1969733 RepID=A0A1X0Y610_9BACT|nr:Npt1/Npt2 family nucleotide transporter [Geothermobacter hydrogeniphilus]ORJ60484.1 hypothetical protein B5V00_07940 [Geothermobacter hydrogeniphilus]